MAEEGRGHVKISIDVEINEPIMDVLQDSMANLPKMMKMAKSFQKEEK